MKAWYTVYTKPRQESLAEANLQRQGFEIYLPRLSEPCRQRGKWTRRTMPLFARYLFVYADLTCEDVAPIRSTTGAVGMVRFGGQNIPVPAFLVEALRAQEDPDSGIICAPDREWQPGKKLRFVDGPFAGLEAIFQAKSGTERAIVLLEILGQSRTLNVPKQNLVEAYAV